MWTLRGSTLGGWSEGVSLGVGLAKWGTARVGAVPTQPQWIALLSSSQPPHLPLEGPWLRGSALRRVGPPGRGCLGPIPAPCSQPSFIPCFMGELIAVRGPPRGVRAGGGTAHVPSLGFSSLPCDVGAWAALRFSRRLSSGSWVSSLVQEPRTGAGVQTMSPVPPPHAMALGRRSLPPLSLSFHLKMGRTISPPHHWCCGWACPPARVLGVPSVP